MTTMKLRCILLGFLLYAQLTFRSVCAWSSTPINKLTTGASHLRAGSIHRREAAVAISSLWTFVIASTLPSPALAYTPDPEKLRESLYLMSRVQEATVQQERFVSKAATQEDLKSKMQLTLKLVEKNYRLLDQINYASAFVEPKDDIVVASEAGYEAFDALQGAIDFVKSDLQSGPLTQSQRIFLATSMQSCREKLFVFLKYMPQEKLEAARFRVEDENVKNRDEFDGEADAGVYNPVTLPWKTQP
jgi:hypothetical protein